MYIKNKNIYFAVSDAVEARSLSFHPDHVDIYSSSWDLMTMEKPLMDLASWPQGPLKMVLLVVVKAKAPFSFGPRATEVVTKTIVIVMVMRPPFIP